MQRLSVADPERERFLRPQRRVGDGRQKGMQSGSDPRALPNPLQQGISFLFRQQEPLINSGDRHGRALITKGRGCVRAS